MKMTVSQKVDAYMKDRGVTKSFLSRSLYMSYPTFLTRLKDDKWNGLELKTLKEIGIIEQQDVEESLAEKVKV